MSRLMLPLLIAVCLAQGTPASASDDPVREKLDKAKADYEQAMTGYQQDAIDWFDAQDAAARRLRTGVSEKVKQVAAERREFEEKGVLPKQVPAGLRDRPRKATEALLAAYAAASDAYYRSRQDELAAAVEAELAALKEQWKTGGGVKAGEAGWTTLFDGETLRGWTVAKGDPKIWTVADGAIVAEGTGDWRKMSFLISDRDYSDFVVRFDYAVVRPADSGFVLNGDPHEPKWYLDVNIREFIEPQSGTAFFFWSTSGRPKDALPPSRKVPTKPLGAWNTMEIESRGGRLRVSVNREEVLQADMRELGKRSDAKPDLTRSGGRIGFQAHTGTVRFRNIKIRDLSKP